MVRPVEGQVICISNLCGGVSVTVHKTNPYPAAAATDNFAYARVAAAAVAIVLLVAAIVAAYKGTQKDVSLLIDGQKLQVSSFAPDVRTLLRERNLELGDNDRVVPALATPLRDGMTVTVRRAVPVTLQVGEEKRRLETAAATVGEFLQENNVVLGERDVVMPGLNTPLQPGMRIKVDRITTQVVEEDVPIPYKTQRQSDDSLFRGIVRVVQPGSQGLEHRKWEVTYKNGKEVERRLLASNVIREPVDRVVKVGTLQTISRGGRNIRFSRAYDMVATAYTHTGNPTYTDVWPQEGMVAVDPSVIPLGSWLYVEGYGFCRAMDIGSAIKGNRIDLFFDTRKEALRWGVRKVRVYVLK